MPRRSAIILVVVGGLLLAGCADPDPVAVIDEASDDTVDEESTATPDDSPAVEAPDAADDGDLGEPADAADASRTIAVDAFDMAFDPETIAVESGEVVTFEVTNTGEAVHEFFLGDSAMQQEHAEEMAEMGHDMPHDEPYSIRVEAGETKQLTWRFTGGGAVEFACHEPGHYAAGMYGQIIVG